MAAYDDIASRLPIDQIAAQLGEDPAEVERAVHTVLPALLGGLQANAADPGARRPSPQALGHHAGDLPDDGTVDLARWTPPTAPRSPATSSATRPTR